MTKAESYDDVLAKVKDILREQAAENAPNEIQPEHDITNDLGLDSLGVMEAMAHVEDAYDITIPNDALPTMHTVGDVARKLTELLRERATHGVEGSS